MRDVIDHRAGKLTVVPAQGRRWSWGEACASHHPSSCEKSPRRPLQFPHCIIWWISC